MRKRFMFVFALIILLGASFVIAASAPAITNVQIKPSPAYSTDVINCSANYNDADGDKGNVSISWYNGSTLYWQATQFNKLNGEVFNEPLTWADKTGLVGYWRFSEGNGTQAQDLSGNGNHGTLTNFDFNSLDGWRQGRFGTGLDFDGKNDYVSITSTASLRPARITFVFWMKILPTGAYQYVIDTNGDSTTQGMTFQVAPGLGGYYVTLGNVLGDRLTSYSFDSNWHHIAFAYSGTNASSSIETYIDGVMKSSFAVAGTPNIAWNSGSPIRIGYGSSYPFNGSIDEVVMFNRSLMSAEITALYQNSPHASGETWNCTINATDSTGAAGVPNSKAIAISSSSTAAPTITNVQIKPSPAYSTDVINCSANYNDADGDKGNVSISWYNGSTLYWQATQFNKLNGEVFNEPLTWADKTGLVGYWKFSEGNGTTVRDISGNENNGTLNNFNWNANSGWTAGKYGSGLLFDGSDDYINVSNGVSLNITNAITLEAWIKSSASSSYRTVISKGYWSADLSYSLRLTRDSEPIKAFITIRNSSGSQASAGNYNNIANDQWFHLVGVYDGSQVCLYVNGTLDGQCGSLTGPLAVNTLPVFIGKLSTTSATEYFIGSIDEVRIYNRSLTPAEITALYQNSPHFSGETWNCTVNATDSTGLVGVPNSKTITISSPTAPTITSIQIKPSPAYSTDVLNCSANYNDADGDKGNVTLSWYNGSTLYWQTTQFNKANGEQINEPLTWINKNGLVGYWKFSEGNGTVARDISGNENSGTLTNFNFNANSGWTAGKYGSGLQFDGVNDLVTFPQLGSFKTISLWTKIQNGALSASGTWSFSSDFYMWYQNGNITFQQNSPPFTLLSGAISLNQWVNIVVICAVGNKNTLYINGVLASQLTYSNSADCAQLLLGRNHVGADPFNGIIDEVRIYNRTLSSAEINASYQNSPHASGETWNCTINATDATGLAGTPNSTTRTISSISLFTPTITNVQIKPSPAYSTDVINCSANYNDADGDKGNVSIYWYNGSTLYWQTTQFNKMNNEVVNEPLTWYNKTGLVGYWKFSEGNGTVTYDISNNGVNINNGTLMSFDFNANSGWTAGKYGSGLLFDGSNDYVDCGNDSSLDNENAISVEAWIKTSYDAPFPGELGIVKKGTGFAGASAAGWSFRLRDDIPSFALRKKDNSGYWDLYVGAKVIDGQWHHIVGTFDTSKIKRYVDGVLEQTGDTGQPYLISSENCTIGVLQTNYFNGIIDEVRVYNRTLTSEEINASYTSSPHARGETWNCTINATDSSGATGVPNSAAITIESVSGYEPRWKHVTVTYSASKKEKKIYVDNVLVRTEKMGGLSNYEINNQTGNLYVSKLYGVPSGNMFNGSIDEMRIYPYALSSSEVGSAYLGSVSYDKLPNQNEAATLVLNGEDVTEMTLAPIVRVSNKERTCDVTSKVKIPKCT